MRLPFLRRSGAPASGAAAVRRNGINADVLSNVYLCHARDAAELLARIDAELQRRRITYSAPSEAGAAAADPARIDAADHFLFLITPGALESARCRSELERARDTGKKLVFLESGKPGGVRPPLPGFTDENLISLAPAEFDAGMRKLLDRVDARLRFDAFLSYSRRDTAFIDELAEALRRAGRKVWLDRHDIRAASNWQKALDSGVAAADSFVFVISPDSVASPFCQNELEVARGMGKLVIPVRSREMDDGLLPPALTTTQYVDFVDGDFQSAVRNVLDAMEVSPEHRARLTWLLNRAIEWRESGDEESRLLDGKELNETLQWLEGPASERFAPTPLTREYVTTSRTHERMRRRRNTRRGVALGVAALVLLGVVATLTQKGRAIGMARAAQGQIGKQPDLALLLGVESLRIRNTPEGRAALFSALAQAPRLLGSFHGHRGAPSAATFSADGQRLFMGTDSGHVMAWPIVGGRGETLARRPGERVRAIAASPDGKQVVFGTQVKEVVSGTQAKLLVFASLDQGRPHALLGLGEYGSVTALAYSSDGTRLLAGTESAWLLVLDVARRVVVARVHAPAMHREVSAVRFHPDGVSAVTSDALHLRWSGRAGDPVYSSRLLNRGERSPMRSEENEELAVAAFSIDGKLATAAAAYGDLATDSTSSGIIEGHAEGFEVPRGKIPPELALSRNGELLATMDSQGAIRLYNPGARFWFPDTLLHNGGGSALMFTPDGRGLVSLGHDGRVLLWDAVGNRSLGRPLYTARAHPYTDAVALGNGAAWLAFKNGGTVSVWRTPLGGGNPTLQSLAGLPWITSLRLAGSTVVASGLREREAEPYAQLAMLWDGSRARDLSSALPPDENVEGLELSPDGRLLAGAASGVTVVLIDVRTGQRTATLARDGARARVAKVAFSADGRGVAALYYDGAVAVWEVGSRKRVDQFSAEEVSGVRGLALSGDGRLLAVTSGTGVLLRDVAARETRDTLRGPQNLVSGLAIDPDGRLVVAAVAEGNPSQAYLFLWDAASRVSLGPLALGGGIDFDFPLAFSATGDTLLTGGAFPAMWEMTPRAWRARACAIVGDQPVPPAYAAFLGRSSRPCHAER